VVSNSEAEEKRPGKTKSDGFFAEKRAFSSNSWFRLAFFFKEAIFNGSLIMVQDVCHEQLAVKFGV
jgi:hypothetical protein